MAGVEVERVRQLRFDDGSPVRAASAVAFFGDGRLVAQDDAAHGAWVREGSVSRVRLVPAVEGHDVFSAAAGTKHLKPDLEAACEVHDGVLLLGSGSSPARTRAVLVGAQEHAVADLAPLYDAAAEALGIDRGQLNMEGACLVGGALRWFARGNLSAGVPSASLDVDLAQLLDAFRSPARPVAVSAARHYDLGSVEGIGLTVTDAVALPDGRVLVSAAAEDTPNAVDDGPVVAAALALLAGERVAAVLPLPTVSGEVAKVEGLALLEAGRHGARLVAVVDDDDPEAPSTELVLRVDWS